MKTMIAELHVHTLLSPCAEVEMMPPLIVQEAVERGIHLLAITDHNATANIAAVQAAAAGSSLTVLPGMELQTAEEVHVLCLFDTTAQSAAFQEQVNASLPRLQNNPEYFGEQFVVDETGQFVRREEQLLITSTRMSIEDAFRAVEALGGLAVPAHVDRKAFGLIANLGFIPPDLDITALEISRHVEPEKARQMFPQISQYPLIQSGDVHRLDDFLGANEFNIQAPTIQEIKMALRGAGGRSHRIVQAARVGD